MLHENVSLGGRPVVGFDGPFDFITKPVGKIVKGVTKAVGGAVTTAYKTASDAASAVAKGVSKIPVLGDVTRIVGDAAAAPVRLAQSIASGARLDRAVIRSVKDHVRIAREAAPYAQTVVSLVPGAGTGVAAAIGTGVALSEGKGIDEAAKAAIKGALPGGPVAAAGFEAALKVAEGKRIDQAALEGARELVPPGPARQAFDVGVAVATGENIQNALADGLARTGKEQFQKLGMDWVKKAARNPDVVKALSAIPTEARPGFAAAMGVLKQAGINQKAVAALRNKLRGKTREGFDLALRSQAKDLPWLQDVLSPPPKAAPPPPRPPTLRTAPVPKPSARPPTLRPRPPPPPRPAPAKPPALRPAPRAARPPVSIVQRPVAPPMRALPTTARYGPYPWGRRLR